MTKDINSKTNLTGAAGSNSTQIATGSGYLERITINTTSAWTIGILDGTASASTSIANIPATAVVGVYDYGCAFANGLRVTTVGHGGDATLVWRQ